MTSEKKHTQSVCKIGETRNSTNDLNDLDARYEPEPSENEPAIQMLNHNFTLVSNLICIYEINKSMSHLK